MKLENFKVYSEEWEKRKWQSKNGDAILFAINNEHTIIELRGGDIIPDIKGQQLFNLYAAIYATARAGKRIPLKQEIEGGECELLPHNKSILAGCNHLGEFHFCAYDRNKCAGSGALIWTLTPRSGEDPDCCNYAMQIVYPNYADICWTEHNRLNLLSVYVIAE